MIELNDDGTYTVKRTLHDNHTYDMVRITTAELVEANLAIVPLDELGTIARGAAFLHQVLKGSAVGKMDVAAAKAIALELIAWNEKYKPIESDHR